MSGWVTGAPGPEYGPSSRHRIDLTGLDRPEDAVLELDRRRGEKVGGWPCPVQFVPFPVDAASLRTDLDERQDLGGGPDQTITSSRWSAASRMRPVTRTRWSCGAA